MTEEQIERELEAINAQREVLDYKMYDLIKARERLKNIKIVPNLKKINET